LLRNDVSYQLSCIQKAASGSMCFAESCKQLLLFYWTALLVKVMKENGTRDEEEEEASKQCEVIQSHFV